MSCVFVCLQELLMAPSRNCPCIKTSPWTLTKPLGRWHIPVFLLTTASTVTPNTSPTGFTTSETGFMSSQTGVTASWATHRMSYPSSSSYSGWVSFTATSATSMREEEGIQGNQYLKFLCHPRLNPPHLSTWLNLFGDILGQALGSHNLFNSFHYYTHTATAKTNNEQSTHILNVCKTWRNNWSKHWMRNDWKN